MTLTSARLLLSLARPSVGLARYHMTLSSFNTLTINTDCRGPCESPGEGSRYLVGEDGADVRRSLVRCAETEVGVDERSGDEEPYERELECELEYEGVGAR